MKFVKILFLFMYLTLQTSCLTHKTSPLEDQAETPLPKSTKNIPSPSVFCEKEKTSSAIDNTEILLCEKMYSTRPFIRPPVDTVPTSITHIKKDAIIYGGLHRRSGLETSLVDRFGRSFKIIFTSDERKVSGKLKNIFTKIKFPSNRILFTLYKVSGQISKTKNGFQLSNINAIEPVLLLTGDAIDSHYIGKSWEGGFYAKNQEFQDEFKTSIRIKTTKTSILPEGLDELAEWTTTKIKGAQVFSLDGYIENFNDPITSSDGKTCFEALTKSQDRNPFLNATDSNISFHRMGSIQKEGDNMLVFEYPKKSGNLAPDNLPLTGVDHENRVLHVINFLQIENNSRSQWGQITIRPQSDNKKHLLKLHPIEVHDRGGQPCFNY